MTRTTNPVGDRAADRVGQCSVDRGERFGCTTGLEVCACDRGVEVRERASVGPDVAERLHGGTQAGDGLQRLPPLLVVLSTGHLDQRRELAVGSRMGPSEPAPARPVRHRCRSG